MKIAVCIKQVVTREWQLRVNDQKTWIRDQDASFELNEPDAYALEEALRLKEKHGGEVIVCCAGPARACRDTENTGVSNMRLATAVPRKPPATCATMYKRTSPQGRSPPSRSATVTTGLKCAPEIGPNMVISTINML